MAPRPGREAKSLRVLLRWEAALAEFETFRRVPAADIERVIDCFGNAVEAALDASPAFERLDLPPLCRLAGHSWDARPTVIFPAARGVSALGQ